MTEEGTDLLVVGAGPAGLAVALAAQREGLPVRVVDRAPRAPVDKACGEGLMPDGVAALARLGIDPAALGGAPFAGIRYVDGDRVAEGRFPGEAGLGVRRTRLQAALVERAEAVGVWVEWGVRVVGAVQEEGSGGRWPPRWSIEVVEGDALEAAVVVAADGLRSRLRQAVDPRAEGDGDGAAETDAGAARFGVRRHYRVPVGELPEVVEVWWGDRCEAYVTPVGPEEVGVAMLWSGRKASFDALLAGFPALADRFVGRPVVSDDRGAGPLLQPVRRVVGGNLALVGDAAGYVDAITGEGLSLAFAQAEALVAAVVAGDLSRYAAAHRRIGRVPNAVTRLLVAVERRPALRRRMLRALEADPALFDLLLAVHARQRPARALLPGGAARLAWGLATAGKD